MAALGSADPGQRPEETFTQVETAFLAALEAEGLPELAAAALRGAIASSYRDQVHGLPGGQVPLLLAISDNGRQMRSVTTRGSWPGWRSSGSSAGRAWIETLFGYVKGEWPHLEKIRDPGELDAELDRVQAEYNSVRLHAAMGYVTRTTSTKAGARRSAGPATAGSPRRGWAASHTVGTQPLRRTSDREPSVAGYYKRALAH